LNPENRLAFWFAVDCHRTPYKQGDAKPITILADGDEAGLKFATNLTHLLREFGFNPITKVFSEGGER
jgi:hypothetical protein